MLRDWEPAMSEHVYKLLELVGSSKTSIEDAIQKAITRANESIRHVRWFEVLETRGMVENGEVAFYQVRLKLGFTLDGVPLGDMEYGNVNGLHISRAISTENLGEAQLSEGTGAPGTCSSSATRGP